jgi:hypothetical protein
VLRHPHQEDGCEPMSVHATMAKCQAGQRIPEIRHAGARVTGFPVVVSYQCVAVE